MDKQYITKYEFGTYYYKDPEKTIIHRTDGPAIVYPSGTKQWLINGKLHRLDGPAAEYPNGNKQWVIDNSFIFEVNKSGKIIDRMK